MEAGRIHTHTHTHTRILSLQIKCEQYWPEDIGEPKQYGDVVVEVTSYSSIRTYDYRMFKITNVSQNDVLFLRHLFCYMVSDWTSVL